MNPAPPKLLVFAGSTRAQSWNRKLAACAAQLAREAGAEVTLLELAEHELPIYNGDLEARGLPPEVLRLKQIFHAHAGWIISTPEYNGSYPALLKNTLDWISRPVPGDPEWSEGLRPFAGKVVGLLSASPGALGGLRSQSHLAPLLLVLQCWVAPRKFALGKAGEAFAADGSLVGESSRKSVRAVIDQVIWAAQRLSLSS